MSAFYRVIWRMEAPGMTLLQHRSDDSAALDESFISKLANGLLQLACMFTLALMASSSFAPDAGQSYFVALTPRRVALSIPT
jgi:hypothetical protein